MPDMTKLGAALYELYPEQMEKGLIEVINKGGKMFVLWPADIPSQNLEQIVEAYEAGELDRAKAAALAQINNQRGQARVRLGLTKAEFQELVYSGKMMQAQRWRDLNDPDAPFPFVLEAQARKITNEQMADLIIAQGNLWLAGSDAIEATYIIAKTAVDEASTTQEVQAVLDGLSWPV
jgi:hypothetical protein